jgi:hypothetical protein
MGIEDKIANCQLLTDIFGRFPSFHDAEVLSVTLDRQEISGDRPNLKAAIYVFEMTPEVSSEGKYVLKNQVISQFCSRGSLI